MTTPTDLERGAPIISLKAPQRKMANGLNVVGIYVRGEHTAVNSL